MASQLYDSLGHIGLEQDTLVYIATSGWTTTNLKNAILSETLASDFNLVSLLIGVNNQYQRRPFSIYEEEFPELLDLALQAVNYDSTQVFVISIPDYAYTPFDRGNNTISSELDDYNQFAQDYCDSLGIEYYYITDISRLGFEKTSLVARDGLHPSGAQYQRWVERIMASYIEEEDELITNFEDYTSTSLKAYPNPTYETLHLSADREAYVIYNINGEKVQTGIATAPIDVSELNKGTYYISCKVKVTTFVKL